MTIMITIIKEALMKDSIKIIAIFLLCCSVMLALYPTVSRLINKKSCNDSATEFSTTLEHIQEGSYQEAIEKGLIDNDGVLKNSDFKLPVLFKEDLERLYKDSVEYNTNLQTEQNIYHSSDFEKATLNLSAYGVSNGMYGYLKAESINLTLPIYLGATEKNMRYGTAHLNMTSLPTGGVGTNTVLAGHTGYTGKTFFDNIRYLKEGDVVVIQNYFETLSYKVCVMKNIESSDIADIYVKDNKDTLTLMTCSNGGATRLLVICERNDIK